MVFYVYVRVIIQNYWLNVNADYSELTVEITFWLSASVSRSTHFIAY